METILECTRSGKIAHYSLLRLISILDHSGNVRRITPTILSPNAPALPLTVVCNTLQQASNVNGIQDVVAAHAHASCNELLAALLQSQEVMSVLANYVKFYSVVFGIVPTGIYLDMYAILCVLSYQLLISSSNYLDGVFNMEP